jgi:hypothetical protein
MLPRNYMMSHVETNCNLVSFHLTVISFRDIFIVYKSLYRNQWQLENDNIVKPKPYQLIQ